MKGASKDVFETYHQKLSSSGKKREIKQASSNNGMMTPSSNKLNMDLSATNCFMQSKYAIGGGGSASHNNTTPKYYLPRIVHESEQMIANKNKEFL